MVLWNSFCSCLVPGKYDTLVLVSFFLRICLLEFECTFVVWIGKSSMTITKKEIKQEAHQDTKEI